MSKSSGSTVWKPMLRIVAMLGVAVLAIGGLTHLRHQRATAAQLAATAPAVRADQKTRVRENFGALPLAFEANQGQSDPQVKYMARGSGYTVFLTGTETVLALHSSAPASTTPASSPAEAFRQRLTQKQIDSSISMKLAGGNAHAQIAAQDELPGHSNYFIGNHPSQWHTDVKQYSRVSYREVYPGIDMAFHGHQRQLEFDFIVAPGANAAPIRFDVSGAQKISTDADGDLVLASKAGNVLLHKPVAYQEKNNTREPVNASFVVEANNRISLAVGNYDRSRELIIDPSVTYATYLGGTNDDEAYGIAVDASGNAYVTGETASTNFPVSTTAAFKTSKGGAFDAFVSKISADGKTLTYSTYVGGTNSDGGNAIAVDSSGNAYVAGATNSTSGFPVTAGVVQSGLSGGFDAFVIELNSTGSALTFCTYLGGTLDDYAFGIAVDSTGVYVVGSTASSNFPHVSSGFQTTISGTSSGFVAKLNPAATGSPIYASYLGGGTGDFASAVAVHSNQAYVTGATANVSGNFPTKNPLQSLCGGAVNGCSGPTYDAFVTVVDSAGSGLVYSTFLGGTGSDQGQGIAVDGSGNAYVTGSTTSTNFPLQSALQTTFKGTRDAFVTEINAAGSAKVYSTYLGGSSSQTGTGIAVDGSGNAYVTGATNSTDFPTSNATQTSNGGLTDAFVTEIASGGTSSPFSTYLGGASNENLQSGGTTPAGAIAVDNAGANIYVAGVTASSNFPVTTGAAVQTTYGGAVDAFVAAYSTGASTGSFTIDNGALSNTSGSPGVLANATITVNSTGGFNSAVTLACAVSPVVTHGPTCGFTGNPVTPPANSSATATLNVATTAASARLTPPGSGRSGMLYAMILPVFGLALVGFGFGPSGSRRRRRFGHLLIGMVLAALLILPACSGGNGGGGGGGGTPPNTYTITVTGSAAGAVVTGSPALTLTVN